MTIVTKIFLCTALIAMTGCETIETGVLTMSQSIQNVTKKFSQSRQKKDSEVTTVPFERVANRATQTGLIGKNIIFNARYSGTEPNPKGSPGVAGHVNVKLCALKTATCSDMFVISNRKAEQLYALNQNQRIAVTAKIVEANSTYSTGLVIDSTLSPKRRYVVIKDINTNLTKAEPQSALNVDVLSVQKKLAQRGYNPGVQDGVWGNNTKQALLLFQVDHQLRPSGEVDGETLEALGLE